MTTTPQAPGSVSRCIDVVKHSKDPIERDRAMEFIFNRYFPKLLRDAEQSLRGISGADPEAPPLSALRHGLTVLRDGERPNLINRAQLLVELYRRHNARKTDEIRKNLRHGRHENIDDHLEIRDPKQKIDELCLEFGELLTEEERLVLDLRDEELTIPEAATRMGIAPRTIDTILKKIRNKRQSYLNSPANLK